MAIEVGNIFEGHVTGVKPFGAFVALPEGRVVMPLGYRHMGYAPPADVGQQKMNF